MMEIVSAVGKKDVVIGYKGSIKREYPGNNLLTKYLEEKRSDYYSESLKPGYKTGRWKKTAVVNTIINILENEGGRFLKRNRENNNMYSIIIKKEIKSAFIRRQYRVSYQPLHCTHMNHPLVPPDDCTLEEYDTRLASSRTHRLYVKGTSYCNDITSEKWNILDCREETKGQYTLKIKLPVGMLVERKHYLSTEEESILHYMNLSGEVSTIEKFNAAVIKLKSFPCRDCTMAAVGRPRKGAVMTDNAHVPGEERPFAVHRNNPTFIDLWKTAIVSFKKTLDQYFPDILHEFAEKRKKGGWKIMEDVGGEEHAASFYCY
jgi:hypothetical protein